MQCNVDPPNGLSCPPVGPCRSRARYVCIDALYHLKPTPRGALCRSRSADKTVYFKLC